MLYSRLIPAATLAAALWGAIAAPSNAFVLDFDTQNGGVATTPGNLTGNEFSQFDVTLGLTNSSGSGLALFDSNCVGNACSGNDNDLGTGDAFGTPAQGNILIIQKPGASEPDDFAGGGTIVFDFARPFFLGDIAFVDDVSVELVGFLNGSEVFSGNFSQPGENDFGTFTFGDDVFVDLLEVRANGSVGLASLEYGEVPGGSGAIPEPTTVLGTLAAIAFGGIAKRRASK